MTNRMKVGLVVVVIALLSVLAYGAVGAQGWDEVWADMRLRGKLWVNSTSEFDGAVVMDSTLAVTGASTLTGVSTFTAVPVFSSGIGDTSAGDITQIINTDENLGMLPTIVSATATYTEANDYTMFVKPADEVWVVHDVWVQVTDDYDVSGDDASVLIGDAGDDDGYCVLADAELQAADTEYTGAVASWQCLTSATTGVYLDEQQLHIVSGARYTVTLDVVEATGATGDAGAMTVYMSYTRLQ